VDEKADGAASGEVAHQALAEPTEPSTTQAPSEVQPTAEWIDPPQPPGWPRLNASGMPETGCAFKNGFLGGLRPISSTAWSSVDRMEGVDYMSTGRGCLNPQLVAWRPPLHSWGASWTRHVWTHGNIGEEERQHLRTPSPASNEVAALNTALVGTAVSANIGPHKAGGKPASKPASKPAGPGEAQEDEESSGAGGSAVMGYGGEREDVPLRAGA
jgi:hypothetical protein